MSRKRRPSLVERSDRSAGARLRLPTGWASSTAYALNVAFDEDLADRMRSLLTHERGLSEKRMFGGLAFLINGNMAVSASGLWVPKTRPRR
jgi:hypothetical protein